MAAATSLLGHVALLRGVNVGGRNRLAMDGLRRIAADLGLAGARTYLQSGNLAFLAPEGEGRCAEQALERALVASMGVSIPVIVRSHPALAATIAANPFAEAASNDPSHLLVIFMQRPPDASGLFAIRSAAGPGETVELVGAELFVHYGNGVARSRLTSAMIDRRLGVAGTARNWTTLLALEAMARRLAEDNL